MTVTRTDLQNGLTVVSHRMDTVETVSLGIWVKVGTRYEPVEINGASHLLEHMAFKGTKRRSALEIAEEIEAVGGHLNAYTSREVTAYHATVLKEDMALAVDIIGDILQNSVFEQVELERERAVVLQEIGQAHDTPEDVIYDNLQATAFPDQPMGRPVLGPPDIVAAMSRDSLVEYMGTHYTAPRMILGAAGRLDHDALVNMAERHFSALGSNGDEISTSSAMSYAPISYSGGDHRESRPLEQAHLVIGFEGVGYHDPDYYPLAIASTLLGGGMSSRLFQKIREELGLVYSIYSFSSSYEDGGLFGLYAGTGEDGLTALLPALCEELARATGDINDKELARAKAQLRTGLVMSLESTSSRAEQLARQVSIFGRPQTIEEMTAKVEAVDKASIEAVLTRVLAGTPTVAAVGPVNSLDGYEAIASRFSAVA
jgi:predicted Zn-dependent peptidase